MIPAAVRSAAEIESAVERFAHEPDGGLISARLTVSVNRQLLAVLAAQHRIPAISGYPGFATAGGLMS